VDNILFVEILSNISFVPAIEQFALLTLGISTVVGVGLLASVLGAIFEVITWKEMKEPQVQAGKRVVLKVQKVTKMKTEFQQRKQIAFDPRELNLGDDAFWPEVVEEEVIWLEKETEKIEVPAKTVQPVRRPINLWRARINTELLMEELMEWANVPDGNPPAPVLLT
jgi:hypothetical protein